MFIKIYEWRFMSFRSFYLAYGNQGAISLFIPITIPRWNGSFVTNFHFFLLVCYLYIFSFPLVSDGRIDGLEINCSYTILFSRRGPSVGIPEASVRKEIDSKQCDSG